MNFFLIFFYFFFVEYIDFMGVSRGVNDEACLVPLPTSLPGNQILSEGIIGDILNEHFGEAVELVGIVLVRNGPLTFSEIWRISNANFLAFPRDMLNTFNIYQSSSSEQLIFAAKRQKLPEEPAARPNVQTAHPSLRRVAHR